MLIHGYFIRVLELVELLDLLCDDFLFAGRQVVRIGDCRLGNLRRVVNDGGGQLRGNRTQVSCERAGERLGPRVVVHIIHHDVLGDFTLDLVVDVLPGKVAIVTVLERVELAVIDADKALHIIGSEGVIGIQATDKRVLFQRDDAHLEQVGERLGVALVARGIGTDPDKTLTANII